jgi:hypothetical protein
MTNSIKLKILDYNVKLYSIDTMSRGSLQSSKQALDEKTKNFKSFREKQVQIMAILMAPFELIDQWQKHDHHRQQQQKQQQQQQQFSTIGLKWSWHV